MKLTKNEWLRGAGRGIREVLMGLGLLAMGLLGMALVQRANADAVSTTTVQGTVYLANGQVGSGTVQVSWPAFVTAAGQAVTAGKMTVTIAPDGFVSVNLAPNLGATPAGLYYTAIYHLSDGTTSTEYWVVPSAAQASLGAVRSQLMPAAQAVQTVSKSYVDQAITELTGSLLTASGGTLSGSLYLNGDPTQALQAADKHYVDATFSKALPLTGGALSGVLTGTNITATQLGGTYQVDQFPGADFGAKLQACVNAVSRTYGGDCDARNFTGTLAMGSNLTISTANTTVQLPCATIATANQLIVTAGTRNVALRGCALRGSSTASGNQGGTVFQYLGTGAMVQVGDPTYAADTMGFHLGNVVISTTATTSATAQGLVAYRTQEMDLESLYFLGNPNQTGMTLDGTGNYTGGTFYDNAFNGFQTAVNAIGHQVTNSATTDWLNASSFVRLHIDCPTSGGSPISGTYGVNLQQGDGNTFTGGDVEGCATAMHLGPNAQNNTIVGLRNENSTNQVVADVGSSYNNWMTGGTMFTGALTDNGTRNSFMDTFHRSFNGMNGDWYGSQQDATVTNHYRLGIGSANERGLLNRYQTDSGYRWTTGLSDATGGEQFYQVLDELNNVYRLSIGQYNNGQSSTNNQTVINAAGTGAVVLNGSTNAGTGGVVIGSGGASETTVATISNAGNAQLNGTLQVGGTSTLAGTPTVKNQADAEIDATLWAGLTANQKESFIYKDYNGASQWYMVKDASNNWALNSGVGGLDSFKAYQSTNSGDTYINASNSTGAVRVNYESGSGAAFNIYGGSSSSLYASFTGTTAIKLPGLAAGSGHNCLQIDNSGYITNTGAACSTGVGTVGSASAGQIAYYTANGASIGGVSAVPLTAGGTGSTTAAGGLANLGGMPLAGGTMTGALTATQFNGPLSGNATTATALAATPAQCATNKYSTGVTASGTANCSQMTYTQIGGTVPTWNQNTSGTASNVTGTVNTANGGTGATTAAGAFTNIVAPGGTMTGALTAPQFNGLLSGNVVGNLTGNVMGNVSGTASNVTGTVLVSNGGTGAATAAGALANLLPGVTTDGVNGVAIGGNTQLSGTLQVGGTSTLTGTPTVKNQADAEIDATLWAGLTANQKESFIYKDYRGASQWYMVKDASNNWALNSGVGGLDSFKAYQSTNSGDTYINASNSAGAVRVNYESGSGMGFNVYGGNSNSLYASFTAPGSILFPGLAAGTGHNCLQIDSSGYITNTGSACGSTTSSNSITVSSAGAGAVAYYSGNGTSISGESAVPLTAGGTGASTASGALANLGAQAALGYTPVNKTGDTMTGALNGTTASFAGNVTASSVSAKNMASIGPRFDVTQFGAAGNGSADDTAAIQAAFNACWANGTGVQPYGGVVEFPGNHTYLISSTINAYDSCRVEGVTGAGTGGANAPTEILWGGATYGATASLTSFAVSLNVASITLTGNPNPGDTVTVNGVVVTFVASGAVGNQVNIGASAAATATALWTFLQTFTTSGSGPIYNSYPFTNPSAGVVDFKYQSIGLNGLVESVATSDPANITVQAAYYTPANPSGGRNHPYQYVATIQATNSYAVGNWVYMTGFSTQAGTTLNNLVSQVAAASGSSFVIGFPESNSPSVGSYTDTGTSTSISVDLATDSYARYQQGFDNIQIIKGGIAFYMGSRIDTGSHFYNTWAEKQSYFGYYIAAGGINPNWDHGWRAGSPGVAGIYWRGNGYFAVANGQTDSSLTTGAGSGIMLDNQGCNGNNDVVRLTLSNVGFEANPSFSAGMGAIVLYDCAYSSFSTQFQIGMNGVNVTGDSGVIGYYTPSIVMSPANDSALNLSVFNSDLQSSSTNPRWIGIPSLIRQDASFSTSAIGNEGFIPILSFSPSFKSMAGAGTTNQKYETSLSQCLGDCNIGQLWQYGIHASALLYSDTAYAALPNATTLYAGQVLAPPAYWNGANGKRYTLDVVYQAGTTGTPNSGSTTCSGTSGTNILTCSSATDLSAGEYISVGTNTDEAITTINATNSNAVQVTLSGSLSSTVTNAALSFFAPVLGPEMQLPTKSSAAPTSLAWSQGDMEQNSSATANGIAGWVNVAAGTPGTWAGIPLGNNSGQLLFSQVANGTQSTLPVCPNGAGGTLTTSGCTTSTGTSSVVPAWLQFLGTGANGSNTNASGAMNGEYWYTNFTVPYGNVVTVNNYLYGGSLVIHATGTCTIAGQIIASGATSTVPTTVKGVAGAQGGGSGGGTAAGAAGINTNTNYGGYGVQPNGAALAGGAGGGNGTNGVIFPLSYQRVVLDSNTVLDGTAITGGVGAQGGSSGGTGGEPGSGVILICGAIAGIDGTHTGSIDVAAAPGNPPSANSTGAGSGGGGGVAILSSQIAVTTWPNVYYGGGAGGQVTVPYAVPAGTSSVASGNSCTTQPKLSLGVTSGVLSSCTVITAGVGCGSSPNINWTILGGSGSGGTITPTWSSGTVASCTASGGSGYTATTYTTSGTGGDGGSGWMTEFQGW